VSWCCIAVAETQLDSGHWSACIQTPLSRCTVKVTTASHRCFAGALTLLCPCPHRTAHVNRRSCANVPTVLHMCHDAVSPVQWPAAIVLWHGDYLNRSFWIGAPTLLRKCRTAAAPVVRSILACTPTMWRKWPAATVQMQWHSRESALKLHRRCPDICARCVQPHGYTDPDSATQVTNGYCVGNLTLPHKCHDSKQATLNASTQAHLHSSMLPRQHDTRKQARSPGRKH
jgi:hypothetical protein